MFFAHLLRATRGEALSSYAIVVGLVAIVAIGAVAATGGQVEPGFCVATSAINQIQGGTADCVLTPDETPTDPTADTVPNAFGFASLSGQAANSPVESNTVAISGIDAPAPAGITGPGAAFAVGGGPWVTSGTIQNGQSVKVRLTTGPADGSSSTAILTIGGVAGSFSASTGDSTPDGFAFTPVLDAVPGQTYTSDAATITGLTLAAQGDLLGQGNAFFLLNSSPVGSSGLVGQGDQVAITMDAPALADGSTHTATLTIGGIAGVYSITTADLVPDAFAFLDLIDQAPDMPVDSDPVVITGITGATTVTVAGDGNPQLVIAGGGPVTSGTISNGQSLVARLTAGSGYGTVRTATITVGGVADAWSVTTGDSAPDTFAFTDVAEQSPGAVVLSETLTPTGYASPAAVSIASGLFSINGGPFASQGVLNPGDTLQLRGIALNVSMGSRQVVVTVGGVSSTWTIGTGDALPDPLTFTPLSAQGLGTHQSNIATVSGLGVPVALSVTNGVASIAGGPWVSSGTIANGESIQLQTTVSQTSGATITVQVAIGTGNASWQVGTQDTTPNAFAFTDAPNQSPGSLVTSNSLTITGLTAAAPVTITGGEFKVGSGSWGTSGTIANNQTLQLRTTASSADAGMVDVVVDVGGVSDSWRVTTTDATPDDLGFSNLATAWPGSTVQSEAIIPVGYDGPLTLVANNGSSSGYGIQKNGSGGYANSVTINPGDNVRLRVNGSTTSGNTTQVVLRGGSAAGPILATWTVTAGDVPDLTNQPADQLVESADYTPQGLLGSVSVSTSGGIGSFGVSIDGGQTWATSATLPAGGSFRVRNTTLSNVGQLESMSITLAGDTNDWRITTGADGTPDADSISYAFSGTVNLSGTLYDQSNAPTPDGYNQSLAVSITPASGQISINGGAWTGSGTIQSGRSLRTRVPAAYAGPVTVTVGGVSWTWTAP